MIAHAGGLVDQLVVAAVLVASTIAYVAVWSATRVRPALQWWLLAVAAVLVADSSAMRDAAERTFTGHMVQHLVIMCLAAPAFVLARPGRLLATVTTRPGSDRTTVRDLERRLRSLGRANAVVGPAAAVVILVVIHLTSVYDLALRSPVVHHVEHAGFLVAGAGLWIVVLGPRHHRGPWRAATAFGAVAAMALLGMVLATASAPLSAEYAARAGAAAALDDQRQGATLMWVGGMMLTLPLVMVAVWRWATAEEQAVRRQEQLRTTGPR